MRFKKRSEGADISQTPASEEKSPKNPRKAEISVIIYTVIMFVAALVLILVSYASMQRAAAAPESPGLYSALDTDAPETSYSPAENSYNGGIEP